MRKLILAWTLLLAGCASHAGDFRQHSTGGWNAESVRTAKVSWLYAQLSNNAYEWHVGEEGPDRKSNPPSDPPFLYVLPQGVAKIDHGSQPYYGLQYVVYERTSPEGTKELILAFRGTQFSHLNDWWQGNVLGSQNFVGIGLYDVWRERRPDQAITVTGHSLGGGISTHISLNRPAVRSIVFNTSPRFWRDTARTSESVEEQQARRRSVVEFGEILKVLRMPGSEATQLYTSLGCTTGHDAIEQHSISRLATCLTFIAAYDDPIARQSICDNGLLAYWPALWARPENLTCGDPRPAP